VHFQPARGGEYSDGADSRDRGGQLPTARVLIDDRDLEYIVWFRHGYTLLLERP
jgi:hypothetical protein